MTDEPDAVTRVPGRTATRGLTTVTVLWVVVLAGMLSWMAWQEPRLPTEGEGNPPRFSDEQWQQMDTYYAVLAAFGAVLVATPFVLACTAALVRLRWWAVSYLVTAIGLAPIAAGAVWLGSVNI